MVEENNTLQKNTYKSDKKITERVLKYSNGILSKRIENVKKLNYNLYSNTTENFNTKTFTLIITIFNSNIEYIKKCLKSAFNQTTTNLEIIVVDNGTNAEIKHLIWSYFFKHDKVKIIETSKNEYDPFKNNFEDPIINLWNAALFCSNGDYVYFLSYDDFISENYAESMLNLFIKNNNCITAAPLVCSINEESEINKIKSEELKNNNFRGRYTNGVELAKSYMKKDGKILFPGGYLSINSNIVLQYGGFDNMHDWSQIFKFAIHGESGFDDKAMLFWRHHGNQTNKFQKKLGLVYVDSCRSFLKDYKIKDLHIKTAGKEFSNDFNLWYKNFSKEFSLSSVRDSLSFGLLSYFKAISRLFIEKAPLNYYLEILYYFPIDILKYTYNKTTSEKFRIIIKLIRRRAISIF